MVLKSINVQGEFFSVSLNADGSRMTLSRPFAEAGGGDGESLVFSSPLEATQVAAALVEAAVRWKTLRG